MKKIILTLTLALSSMVCFSQVTYSKDVFGNTIATDQNGHQGTYSKDVFGK